MLHYYRSIISQPFDTIDKEEENAYTTSI